MLPLTDRYIVEEERLVQLLSDVYLLTVEWKRDDYGCWPVCQVSRWHLIGKIYPIMDCVCGHRLGWRVSYVWRD